jgi:hypothetical protein
MDFVTIVTQYAPIKKESPLATALLTPSRPFLNGATEQRWRSKPLLTVLPRHAHSPQSFSVTSIPRF